MAVNMKEQSNSSQSCWSDTHLSLEDSKLLLDKQKEMEKSVEHILRLIEEKDEYFQNKPELALHFKSFCHNYQLLAEHYQSSMGKLQKSDSHVQIPRGSESFPDQGIPPLMPNQKSGLQKSDHHAASPSSGGGISDLSVKEETDSSSLSSDSDSESSSSSSNIYIKSSMGTDTGEAQRKRIGVEMDLPSMKDKLQLAQEVEADVSLKIEGKKDYEGLTGRLLKCEEELKSCNLQLQFSEEEVARLKNELEKRESALDSANLQIQSAERDIMRVASDLQLEKELVSELRTQIVELEAQATDSSYEIVRLKEELNISKDRIKESDEEVTKLKHELQQKVLNGSHFQSQLRQAQEDLDMARAQLNVEKMKVVDLQDKNTSYCGYLSTRDHEVKELKDVLSVAKEKFSEETAQLKSDIVGFSNKQAELEARLSEWEWRGKQLEDKLKQCQAEKAEMRDMQSIQETEVQVQINQLKAELAERGYQIESLNKDQDKLKLKYDMLMAEKDGIAAKVHTLLADASSREMQIEQMEERLRVSDGKHLQLVFKSESAQKLVNDLKARVGELEKEVERQRVMISDRGEEKKEAIRQLCFALEHYRSGYKQLYQAVVKHKHRAVMAS